MVLYSADIMDVAQKVKSVKEKKPLTAKQLAAIEKRKAKENVVNVEEEPKKVVKKRVKKEKPLSVEEPKSLEEALEEALEEEPKKRKRAPKKKDPALECFLEPKPDEEKVEVEKPKRKRAPKKSESVEPIEPVEEKEEDEKPKRKRAKKIPETVKTIHDIEKESEPPVWFKKYIEGVQREKKMQAGEKVAKKQLKEEAEGLAQKSWEDGLTRDRVNDELDNHMSRMHRMIFGR